MLDVTCEEPSFERRAWISLLSRAPLSLLEAVWIETEPKPLYRALRGPEIGLVMLRGRIGGTGAPFNVGEATVTRCSIEIADGPIGHANVLGRNTRHAELAAVYDGLMQLSAYRAGLSTGLLARIRAVLTADLKRRDEEREATRVEFFTMVRGED